MFLPFIPKISAIEYLNTMILSSIWKFGLIGIFMSVAIGICTLMITKIMRIMMGYLLGGI